MKKFWNWIKNEDTGQRELWFEGVISPESWYDDNITPAIFKEELFAGSGPITIHINSPGNAWRAVILCAQNRCYWY